MPMNPHYLKLPSDVLDKPAISVLMIRNHRRVTVTYPRPARLRRGRQAGNGKRATVLIGS